MLLFQSTGVNLPIWAAVLLASFPVVSSVVAVLLTNYYNRGKIREEVKSHELENERKKLENKDAKDDVFEQAQTKMDKYRQQILALQDQVHTFEVDARTHSITLERLNGKIELIEQQKENVVIENSELKERNTRLHEENVKEKELCQQQIADLKKANDKQFSSVMGKLTGIEKYLRENNIQLPAEYGDGTN